MKLFIAFIIFSGFKTTWAKGDCKTQDVQFVKDKFQVEAIVIRPEKSYNKTILIIPPTGGTNFIDRDYSNFFCKNGYELYIINHWTDDNEFSLDLQIHERFYVRANQAIKLVLSQINSEFIGLLGTSVGAIHALNAIERFSEIDAALLITGGGPIPEIIANSDQADLAQARKKRFELFGFKNINDYTQALQQSLSFNRIKKPANPNLQFGMVIANSDTTVPTRNQIELKRQLAPNYILQINGNHLFAILKTWICYKNEIVRFFEESRIRNKR